MSERYRFRHTPELPRTQTFVDAGIETTQLVPALPAQSINIETPNGAAPEDVFGAVSMRSVEHTSPMAQARGFLVKYAGLSLVLAVLSVGLVWWLRAPAPVALITFAALAIIGYWGLAYTESVFTTAGVERHRLTQGARVLRAQIDAERDVRMAQVALQQSVVDSQREYNRQLAERHRQRLQSAPTPATTQSLTQEKETASSANSAEFQLETHAETDTPAWVQQRPVGADATARNALLAFVAGLYERGEDGRLLRVDADGYIARDTIIPFGKRGGLTQAQRQQAQTILTDLERSGLWLLRFDGDKRLWRLNVRQYPTADAAVDAVDGVPSVP